MVKIIFCLRRNSSLSQEEFYRYWRTDHAALVKAKARLLGIRRYVQSHRLLDPGLQRLADDRGFEGQAFDGVAELWFDSASVIAGGGAIPQASQDAARALLEDEGKFIDLANSPIFVVEEFEILPCGHEGTR